MKWVIWLFVFKAIKCHGVPFFSGLMELVRDNVFAGARGMVNCLLSTGWSDPELGDFYPEPQFCQIQCKAFFCCAPQRPEEFGLKVRLFSRYVHDYHITEVSLELFQLLRPGKIVIVVHGWFEGYGYSDWITDVKDGWLRREDCTVIIMDYQSGPMWPISQVVANTRVISAVTARLMRYLGVSHRALCLGFSLGSAVCGQTGHLLQQRGLKLMKCTGLDPVQVSDQCSKELTLDASDCDVVTVIHTVAYYYSTYAVTGSFSQKAGHCDYWPNCGRSQPNCPQYEKLMEKLSRGPNSNNFLFVPLVCNHYRSTELYSSQLRRNCSFMGHRCVNCHMSGTQQCLVDPQSKLFGMSPDDNCSPYDDENIFFETTGHPPYCSYDGKFN